MKKLLTLLLVFTLACSALVGCNQPEDETVIRIGYMQGPTGMGMAKLIHDNGGTLGNEKYQFVKFEDAQKATAAILEGSIDMACLPTNNASVVYNTKDAAVRVLALNCLNSLFVLTKSGTEITDFDDLEGKTIYTISNGTPKAILEYLLEAKGVNATVQTVAVVNGNDKTLAQPSDLASAMIAGAVDIALVPEPVATAAPLKVASMNKDYSYSVALDLAEVFSEISDSPIAMGCIVGSSNFVNDHKSVVDAFLAEYKSSVEFVANAENRDAAAEYIVEAGVLDAAQPAKKSLANLGASIAYKDGDEMKNILVDFYSKINKSLIGGKLPDEDFYYKK